MSEGVALTVILFLATQTGALLVWGARLTERVSNHEGRIGRLEGHQDSVEDSKP
jgi:hypothetical protein